MLGTALAGCTLAACSAEPNEGPATRLESLVDPLASVPDDASDFQAEVAVDAAGNLSGRRISRAAGMQVAGFNAAKLPRKPLEQAQAPELKLAPSLAARIGRGDAKATTEVEPHGRHVHRTLHALQHA